MKTNSLSRVVAALVLSVAAATVHGAWLAPSFEEAAGPGDARVRIATWDAYEREWTYQYISQGGTLRGAEGAIIELRPEAVGASLSALPSMVEPFSLGTIPPPSATPDAIPAGSMNAAGTPVYGRLRVSQVRYQSGPNLGSPAVEVPSPSADDINAEDFNGSVGVHNLTLTVGADNVSFTWDIGRWAKGDVFVGLNNSSFKVLDRDGVFKRFVGVADYNQTIDVDGDPIPVGPITTGCAANWHTGEVFATNFGDRLPAVNVISRHPGAGPWPYADPSRRLSTMISRDDEGTPSAFPIDANPESIVFDSQQNMYVGHSGGHYSTDGSRLMDVNYLPIEGGGYLVDENDEFIELQIPGNPDTAEVRHMGVVSVRMLTDVNGAIVFRSITAPEYGGVTLTVPEMYYEDPDTFEWLENIAAPGSRWATRWPMGKRLHRYNNLNPGGVAAWAGSESPSPTRDIFNTMSSRSGTDWLDLASDQRTVFYTSENAYVHRYDAVTGQQLPDFGGGRLSGNQRFHAIRLLPPGDGSGGLLVAAGKELLRINADGQIVQRYGVWGDADVIQHADREDGNVLAWYSLEVDPGGRTFWASSHDTGLLYRFDLATGAVLQSLRAVDYVPLGDSVFPDGRRVEGICIMWEYTAAQEQCGDGIDNDGDGFIDEDCSPIESCSVDSPGDDDLDGLNDNNDPDCSDELPPFAGDDSYVTNQGAALTIAAGGVLGNDGDPDNVDGDPFNDDVVTVAAVGVDVDSLAQAGVGASVATTGGGTAVLQSNGSFVYTPAPGFHGVDTFVYQLTDYTSTAAMPVPPARGNPATVSIIVRPMVANDSYTMSQGGLLSVNGTQTGPNGILMNDSSQPLTVVAAGATSVSPFSLSTTFTTSAGGTVVILVNGNILYQPLPTFVGTDSFVYQGNDGVSNSYNTATVTITVQDANELVAVNDGIFPTPFGVALTQNLLSNDLDPEGHTFRITRINSTTVTNGTVVNVTNGTVRVDNVNGTVTVTPAVGYSGLLQFTYTIQDQPGAPLTPATSTATVRVQVGSPNIGAVDDRYTTVENTTLNIAAPGILLNDGGAGTLQVYSAGQPPALMLLNGASVIVPTEHTGGFATVNPNGSISYTPRAGFVGTDTFRYRITDQDGRISEMVVVFIDVTPRPPDAVNDTASTPEDTPVLITVLGNDLVSSTRTLTASLTSSATTQGGTVEMVAGQVRYTPKANFCGTDTFTYRATDSAGQIDTATVTVTVSCTIDPAQAVATGGTFTYDGANHPGTCAVTGVNSESLPGTLSYSPGGATVPRNVGTYTVTCSFAGNTDYSPVSATATVVINPKVATVTAGGGSKVYGAADTLSAVASAGFVSADLTAITLSQTRIAGENVGSYVTTATASGAVLGNYAVSYVPGVFTITPAPATVRAHDKVVSIGAPLPTLDGVWTGLVASDGISAVYTTTGTTVAAGTFPITPTPVDPNGRLSNYTLTVIPGTLTVQATATCTATTLTLNQSSPTNGTAGNVRTFTSGAIVTQVAAWSREKSMASWRKAYVGAFGSYGIGVTDSSENGSGVTHTVDNSGRNNYLVFVFAQPTIVKQFHLGWVYGDSDAQVWLGNVPMASAGTLNLNDAVLSSLGPSEMVSGGSSSGTRNFNAAGRAGNVLVIAANTAESNDAFKVARLVTACGGGTPTTSDKSTKSDKSSKSDKSCKSGKSHKSGKATTSDKSTKSGKATSSHKSTKSGKATSSHKSGKSNSSPKSGRSSYRR